MAQGPQRAADAADGIDLILSPALLLPVAPANVVLADSSVAVRGADIAAVGRRAELVGRFPNARELTLDNHLLMPGLVNAHGHLAMTLLRGLGEGEALKAWLENTIWPLEGRWAGPGFVRDGTLLAVAEMIASGTTSAADMYYFPDAAAEVCQTAGFRCKSRFPSSNRRIPTRTAWTSASTRDWPCTTGCGTKTWWVPVSGRIPLTP